MLTVFSPHGQKGIFSLRGTCALILQRNELNHLSLTLNFEASQLAMEMW